MFSEYRENLDRTIGWIKKSRRKSGGSSAYFSLFTLWSNAYPETTGYLIPTLLDYSVFAQDSSSKKIAHEFGEWLISIQQDSGAWAAGLHPARKSNVSIFNTAQILLGLNALFRETGDKRWASSAIKAMDWLSSQSNENGLWLTGHYTDSNPTYYTRVAWPMLDSAILFQNDKAKESSLRALDTLADRLQENGAFELWGFEKSKPAFTHTIAYTLRGFLESSFLIDDWERYGQKTETALGRFYHLAERKRGRLGGAYGLRWEPEGRYTCLTGNLQIALCLMRWYNHENDLRLLNASSKLIEYVNRYQQQRIPIGPLKGSVAGSRPVWGKYMTFRYPNWAAKFYADALMKFIQTAEAIK